jgi:hypothetical protein
LRSRTIHIVLMIGNEGFKYVIHHHVMYVPKSYLIGCRTMAVQLSLRGHDIMPQC